MAGFLPGGIGYGRPAGVPDMGGVLAPQPQGGGIFGSYTPQAGGIFAALKDAASYLGGGGSSDNFANYQAQNQQSQVRQQLLQGLNSEDPATRQQAYGYANLLGIPTDGFQKQQAQAALPKLLQSMQPHTENVAQTAPVSLPNLPGQSIQGGGFSFEAPGMGFQDALAQNGNPELQAQLAPKLIDEMMKGPDNTPRTGVNPSTGKVGQFVMNRGVPQWLDVGVLPEAPKTRNYRQGTQDITEEFQPDGTWKRIGAGAAFKPDTAGGDANKPPTGYRWGANGSLVAIPGGPADSTGKNSKATDTQRVTALFADRSAKANDILGTSADFTKGADVEGTKYFQQKFAGKYMPFGNYINSDDFQRYDQAKRDFVNAVLRKESGAVIGEDEFANAEKQYFPQPGDAEPVIQQKRRNRETAVEGLRRAAGTALDGAPYKPQAQRNAPATALPQLPQKPAAQPHIRTFNPATGRLE